MKWNKTIRIKHLFTENEEHKAIQDSMSKIVQVLSEHREFKVRHDLLSKMDKIPEGDDIIKPVDYANKLLDKIYDIADSESIWLN